MSTNDGTPAKIPSPSARLHEVTMAALHRAPAPPESTVEIGVTAKRLHTWTVTVRGADADECARVAKRLDDELAAKFASELEDDTLASQLAASIAKQQESK